MQERTARREGFILERVHSPGPVVVGGPRLEGEVDRVRGPRFDGQPASRECHRHGAIQELRESLGPW